MRHNFTRLLPFLLAMHCCIQPPTVRAQWKQIARTDLPATCIYFMPGSCTPKVGFLGTQGWMIYRTSDGGKSWTKIKSLLGGQYYVSNFTFKDTLTGWCSLNEIAGGVALQDAVYRTTDAGLTWSPLNIKGDFPSIYYNARSKRLFLSSWDQANKYSTDDGSSWQDFAPGQHCGFEFKDKLHGVMSGVFDPWYFTRDAGVTWQQSGFRQESYQPLSVPCGAAFYTAAEAVSTIYRSDDLGQSWYQTASLSPVRLTGNMLGDDQHLFIQTANDVMTSTDQGATWTSIGGPSHSVDFRMATLNGYLYASDPFSALWRIRYDSTQDQLLLSTDTLVVGNNACTVLGLRSIVPCRECRDSLHVRQITLTGSGNYSLLFSPLPSQAIGSNDSIVIYRFSSTTDKDTARLNISYLEQENIRDTTVTLIGSGNERNGLAIDRDTLQFVSTSCPDVSRSIHLTSPAIAACGDTMRLVSAVLSGAGNFHLAAPGTLPHSLSPSDSILVIRSGDTVTTDSATLTLRFTLNKISFDTTIRLYGQGVIRQAAQLELSLGSGLTTKQLKPGDSCTTTVRLRAPVSHTSLLSVVAMDLHYGGRILSKVTVTPKNGWSITSEQDFSDHLTIVLSHAPYDMPAQESILTVSYRAAIGDTNAEPLWLTNVHFNPADSSFERCVLLALPAVDTLVVTMPPGVTCGDSILHLFIRGEPLVSLLGVHPNPASVPSPTLGLHLHVLLDVKATLVVYSLLGTPLLTRNLDLRKDQTEATIPLPELRSGTYVVQLTLPDQMTLPGQRIGTRWVVR